MKFGIIFSILLISGTFVVPLNTNVADAHNILLYTDTQTNGSGDDNTPPTTRERCFVTATVRAYAEHHDGIHHRNNPDSTFYPGDAFGYETTVTKDGCIANSLKGCKLHSSTTLSAPKNNLGCSAGDSATWGGTSDGGTAVVVPTYAGGAIWTEKEGFALQKVCHTDSDGDVTCTSVPVYASVNLPVPGRVPNMTLDMWTVGEEFTDDEMYLSRNLDESYYVWDAINVVHNPFYLFKNDRVGTIFVGYEKIHDPLNLEEEFFCDASAVCVNTMSLSGFEDWTGTFDYGGGNTVFNATSIADYGEHEIKYIAKLYNIAPQIDQTEQFILELVVQYDPVYDSYVFTVLRDDGKIAFDDRIGYALHYFGSESTAANPDDVIGVHEDRRSKINDYFFTTWGSDPWVYQFIDGSIGASPFSAGIELTWDEAHDVGIVTPESPVAISVAIGADLISSVFPGTIPFEVNSDGTTANFLKAGYGKIKFDYHGLDDVVVDPILQIPRYENATVFNIFESDHFAGFDNTFLTDSNEYMYPESHFWNTINVTALDKDGIVDGTVNLELKVIPNYTIAGTFDIDEYLYDKIVFDTDDDGFAQIIAGLDSTGTDIVIVNGDEVYPLDNLIMAGSGEIILEKTRRVLTSFTQYAEVADQAFDPNNIPDVSDKYLLDTGDAIMAIPLTTSLQTLNPYELQITAVNGGTGDSVTHTFPHPWYEFSIDYDYTLNMADDNVLDIKRDPANPRIMFYKYNEDFGTVESLTINGIVITGDDDLPSCFGVKSVGICSILVPETEYLAELNITAENMWGGTSHTVQPEIDQLEPVIPVPVEAILGLHVYDWVLVLIVLMIMLILGYKIFRRFFLSNY